MNEVLVSVLVTCEVVTVVEVTMLTVETGVFWHRGISYWATTCLFSQISSRGDRRTLGLLVAPGMQLKVVVVVETMFLWMVRGTGVEVTVLVVVAGFAVNVRMPVVQRDVVVAAGRTVTSISVAVCVVASLTSVPCYFLIFFEGMNMLTCLDINSANNRSNNSSIEDRLRLKLGVRIDSCSFDWIANAD